MNRLLGTALIVLAVAGCKKEEPAGAAPSAAPPAPPPAVSVAPEPKTEPPAASATAEAPASAAPAMTAAPAGSVAAAASASAAPAPSGSAEEPKKIAPGGNLTPCCDAIAAAAKKSGKNQNQYKSAAATCETLAKQVKSGKAVFSAAKVTLRAQLSGVPLPNGC